jgi:hypothetical protein
MTPKRRGDVRTSADALNLMIDMLNESAAAQGKKRKAKKKKELRFVWLVWRTTKKGDTRLAMVAGSRTRALAKTLDVGGRVERRRVWF